MRALPPPAGRLLLPRQLPGRQWRRSRSLPHTEIATLQVECNDAEEVPSVRCGQCCSVASRFGMRTLVGIVSFGESECGGVADPRPGVYTNIAAHTSWIKDVMAGVE